MHSSRKSLVIAVTLLSLVVLSAPSSSHTARATLQNSPSLCARNEKIVFSCTVKPNNKIVSLCSSNQLTRTQGYLQYRFGTPAKVELEYPKERTRSQKAFEYSHYFRAQVDLTEISFSIDDFSYTVFDTYNGEEKPAISEQGVTVGRTNAQKDVTYSCRNRAKVDFGNLNEVLENRSSP